MRRTCFDSSEVEDGFPGAASGFGTLFSLLWMPRFIYRKVSSTKEQAVQLLITLQSTGAIGAISMNNGWLGPISLEGDHVLLEPLRPHHTNALLEAAKDTDWTWTLTPLRSREDIEQRIKNGLEMETRDEGYVFAVLLKEPKKVIGSTSYFGVVSKHKRAEIGYTWYTKDQWGTFVNPECKYLLLQHAFEDWHAVRIQLRTDINNLHSQHAIQKLGAQYEGTQRNDGIRPDGTIRNSKLYSIIPDEWPSIKTNLLKRISES